MGFLKNIAICPLQKSHLRHKNAERQKVTGKKKKTQQAITNPKKATLGSTDFKIKSIFRVRRGHQIIMKDSVPQKDETILNLYAPNKIDQNA